MESIYQKIAECEQSGKETALCIITQTKGSTPRKQGSKMLVYTDGSVFGSIGGGNLEHKVIQDALGVLKEGKAKLFDHNLTSDHDMSCGGTVQVYIEPIGRKFRLHIFGAGHIGAGLAIQASRLGFTVTLIDERPEVLGSNHSDGIARINKNHKLAFEELAYDDHTFITSISHLHEYDREIVAHCARQPHAYLGMIGSQRKIAKARQIFTEQNLLTETEMNAIDWPMGIPIECQTPEEIVISILAKLIDVRGKMMKG
ncbi:MAG: XdhC family protein [Bacteroidales bacterium]|nr:XdhC family protein [Bacteroidales bacterium]MCF8455601.1 XdhC family protein [Bacteroidales bacterium]